MTRLFTKVVALTWLITAIVALTHEPRPAPANPPYRDAARANQPRDLPKPVLSHSAHELRVTE
jgi:hypothetical protein